MRRPAKIRERILELRLEREKVAANRGTNSESDETTPLAEAKPWLADARVESLQTEVALLIEELQSHAVHLRLNSVSREQTSISLKRSQQRISALNKALDEMHLVKFESARSEINSILNLRDGSHPLLDLIVGENLKLVEQLQSWNDSIESLKKREDEL